MPADVSEFWLTAEELMEDQSDLEMEDVSQEQFDEAIAKIEVVEVNSRSSGALRYSEH